MKLKVVIATAFVGLAATACSTVGHAATQGGAAPAARTTSVSSTSAPRTQGSSAATSAHLATTSQSTTSQSTTTRSTTSQATATARPTNSTNSSSPQAETRVSTKTVLFDCLNHPVVEPSSYVLTCADYGSILASLKWTSWTAEGATAVGVHELNDCTPNCAEGKFQKFPAIITFWRPEPVAGHPGEKYFSKITVRYTGPRPPMYMSNGQLVKNPASWTQTLGS